MRRSVAAVAVAVSAVLAMGPTAVAGPEQDGGRAGGTAAPPLLAPGRAFTMAARGCTEVQTSVLIPSARAQQAVPAPFQAREVVPGRGAVAIGVRRCDAIAVDGVETAQPTPLVGEVGIVLETPTGETGQHFYQLWSVSTVADLAASVTHLGIDGGLVPGMAAAVTAAGGTATVPWEPSPYSIRVVSPGAAVVPSGPVTFTWWHAGHRGTVRADYQFPPETLRPPLAGTVKSAAGSRLAELLGSTTAVGVLGTVIDLPAYTGTFTLDPGSGG